MKYSEEDRELINKAKTMQKQANREQLRHRMFTDHASKIQQKL